MAKKRDPQEEIRKSAVEAERKQQVKDEFQRYLKESGLAQGQESIESFTISRTRNGAENYKGFTERELIEILGGKVPPYY